MEKRHPALSLLVAVFLGFFVVLIELPCTGAPYFAILGMLSQGEFSEAIPLLLLYNLIFILPLIVIVGLAYLGTSEKSLKKWREEHKGLMRLLIGLFQFLLDLLRNVAAHQYSFIRGQGALFIRADIPCSDAFLLNHPPNRLPMIEIRRKRIIQFVQHGDDLQIIKSLPTDVSPDNVSVPLLHIHVVVLLVRFGTGECNWWIVRIAPTLEMPVYKLAAGIRMKLKERKRELLLNLLD